MNGALAHVHSGGDRSGRQGHPEAAAALEVRWGAAALALGAVLFVVGIVLGLRAFDGDWDTSVGATLPDTAALIRERWATFRMIWLGELLGALLLALAGLLLQRRPQLARRWLPAGVVWGAVTLGSVIAAVQYALALGSYPPALDAFAEAPAVFAALRGGLLFTHAVGSVLQLLGLLAALALSFRWRGRAVPDRLVQGAAGVALAGLLAAVTGLIPGEYGAAAVFLAAALLGLALWLDGPMGETRSAPTMPHECPAAPQPA